jgi:hypothetical protein
MRLEQLEPGCDAEVAGATAATLEQVQSLSWACRAILRNPLERTCATDVTASAGIACRAACLGALSKGKAFQPSPEAAAFDSDSERGRAPGHRMIPIFLLGGVHQLAWVERDSFAGKRTSHHHCYFVMSQGCASRNAASSLNQILERPKFINSCHMPPKERYHYTRFTLSAMVTRRLTSVGIVHQRVRQGAACVDERPTSMRANLHAPWTETCSTASTRRSDQQHPRTLQSADVNEAQERRP